MLSARLTTHETITIQDSHWSQYKKQFNTIRSLFESKSDPLSDSTSTGTPFSSTSSQANETLLSSVDHTLSHTIQPVSMTKELDPHKQNNLTLEVYERPCLSPLVFDISSLGSFNINFDSLTLDLSNDLVSPLPESDRNSIQPTQLNTHPEPVTNHQEPEEEEFEEVDDIDDVDGMTGTRLFKIGSQSQLSPLEIGDYEEQDEGISSSIMESYKELSIMEKILGLFKAKKSKEYYTHHSVTRMKVPLNTGSPIATRKVQTAPKYIFLPPPKLTINGDPTQVPIDISIFRLSSEESSVYENTNIKFEENADMIIYHDSPIISTSCKLTEINDKKYPGLKWMASETKQKRKMSFGCLSKSLTFPRFRSRKDMMERSLSLPRDTNLGSNSAEPLSNNIHNRLPAKPILKSRINQNLETEKLNSVRDDSINFEEFLQNFEIGEKEKFAKEHYLNSLRFEQVKSYYNNYGQ